VFAPSPARRSRSCEKVRFHNAADKQARSIEEIPRAFLVRVSVAPEASITTVRIAGL
jgi:hypothetical protein